MFKKYLLCDNQQLRSKDKVQRLSLTGVHLKRDGSGPHPYKGEDIV